MKSILVLILAIAFFFPATATWAQQNTWVQVQAVRTLAEAEASARAYSSAFPNVVGYRMSTGWYAIALGPYTRAAAEAELRILRSRRLIPPDSYLAFGRQYRQQYWPVGAEAAAARPLETPTALPGQQEAEDALAGLHGQQARAPDETRRQARASEAALDAAQRKLLQESLKWDEFYTGAIDGAFGPGTRRAMAAWQDANDFEPTGVLTTNQRAALVEGYRAAFDPLALASVRDTAAGISITLPTAKVSFARTDAPFVHYDSTDEDGVRVILISQTGDAATLWALYDVMQTLQIVPRNGVRERRKRSFVLTGQSKDLQSYTFARVTDGTVKGFTLAWQPKDEKVMNRVAQIMRDSFTPISGSVLPDTAVSTAGTEQSIDLFSGLEISQPERSRSGFFVAADGQVLTTTDVLGQCERVTIGDGVEAGVAARDDSLGLALLKPREVLTPLAVAEFLGSVPRLNSEVALAGFSYGEVLDLPVMTYGRVADIRGLAGEDTLERLDLSTQPGDFGGPVFDRTGAVLGILKARDQDASRRMPPNVNFAVDVPAIAGFLGEAGLSPRAADRSDALAPEDLASLASDITVRVSCWN